MWFSTIETAIELERVFVLKFDRMEVGEEGCGIILILLTTLSLDNVPSYDKNDKVYRAFLNTITGLTACRNNALMVI